MELAVEHIKEAIRRLVEQKEMPESALGIDLENTTSFESLAMDSLALAGMALILEDVTGMEIDWNEDIDLLTIEDLLGAATLVEP